MVVCISLAMRQLEQKRLKDDQPRLPKTCSLAVCPIIGGKMEKLDTTSTQLQAIVQAMIEDKRELELEDTTAGVSFLPLPVPVGARVFAAGALSRD